MTTSTTSVLCRSSTDAYFQGWGSAISAAFAAVGLVQTADTGQIDWGSVASPSSGLAGYEIWRFDDAMQSVAPVYLKFQYGNSAKTYENGRIQLDVGTGSDGAGNLTGVIKTSVWAWIYGYNTGWWDSPNNKNLYVCFTNGTLTLNWSVNKAANPGRGWCYVLERTKDASGVADSRGLMATGQQDGNTTVCVSYMYRRQSGLWTGYSWGDCAYPTDVSSVVTKQRLQAVPWTPRLGGEGVHGMAERTLGRIAIGNTDLPDGEVFAVKRWDGIEHTYRTSDLYYTDIGNRGACRAAVLWE